MVLHFGQYSKDNFLFFRIYDQYDLLSEEAPPPLAQTRQENL